MNAIKYDNPWYTPNNVYSNKVFTRNLHQEHFETYGRGSIVKVSNKQYDYLVDGRVVTQRVWHSVDVMNAILDFFETGTERNTHINLYGYRLLEAYFFIDKIEIRRSRRHG